MHTFKTGWTDAELVDSILAVCDEFPYARMTACWRTLEHCRQTVPRGSFEALRGAMREALRREVELQEALQVAAA